MLMFLIETTSLLAFLFAVGWVVVMLFSDANVALMVKMKWGKQPDSLKGKIVWITGASSGIGEYYAYCLAESGCKLVLSARREKELDRVKHTCLALPKCSIEEADIFVLPLDVTDYQSHRHKVQEVLKVFKKIDILINNAGKSQLALWMDVELDVDRHMFEVNVLGPVSLTQALLPHMKERKQGHIVVVSSLAGKMGAAGMRSYVGAKHALQGYFDCLRTEIADFNIDVTIICPGPVHSNILLHAATGRMGEAVGRPMLRSERRMTPERHAYLSCVAIANKQYEAWLTRQPILSAVYLSQFFPGLFSWLMCKLGTKQIMAMREGKA